MPNMGTRYSDLRDNVDVILLLIFFVFFIHRSYKYEGTVGQMPRLFLISGAIFLSIELLIVVSQSDWADVARDLNTIVGANMNEHQTEEEDENDVQFINKDVILMGLIMLGSILLSYLIGFLFMIPAFSLAVTKLLKYDNYRLIIFITALLMIFVYVLFGLIINVPVTDGVLL